MKTSTLVVVSTASVLCGVFITSSLLVQSGVAAPQTSIRPASGQKVAQIEGGSFKAVTRQKLAPEQSASLKGLLEASSGLLRQAEEAFEKGDYPKAVSSAREALRISARVNGEPFGAGDAYRVLGRSLVEQGRPREALEAFIGSRRFAAEKAANLDAALCYSLLGDHDKALANLDDDVTRRRGRNVQDSDLPSKQSPQGLRARIYLAIGSSYSEVCDEKMALRYYVPAAKLAPENGLIAHRVAKSLLWLKQQEEAIPYYRIAAAKGRGEVKKDAEAIVRNYEHWKTNGPMIEKLKAERRAKGLPERGW